MAFGNYEISAKLVIDNKNAKKALKETTKELGELKKANDKVLASEKKKAKYQDEVAKKIENNAKRTANAYNKEYTSMDKLTANITKNRLEHQGLKSAIEAEHKSLINQNATIQEATKHWKKWADARGLTYSKGRLSSALKDDALNIKSIGNTSESAIRGFTNGYNKLQSQLRNGTLTTSQFNSKVSNLASTISGKYGVSIRNVGNANYQFKNSVNSVEKALLNYQKALVSSQRQIQRGVFSQANRINLAQTRDELGRLVMGTERYNQVLKQNTTTTKALPNTYNEINKVLTANYRNLGLNKTQINNLNNTMTNWRNTVNNTGGSLGMIANKTGNYNKLLTTTTRSQRMQNYMMQVTALRYNAIGTMAGFVGGMLVQQLAFGFAEARIQAVKFEQQAQQMLKTSDLSTTSVKNLTKAVEEYTASHRKLNTQGLKYTVAQVTKLNNLSEAEAKKAIPVIADISNMMQVNGRTQEDAILAVNDALDGQFKRLQEIGVQGKEQLKGLGWTGKLDNSKDVMSLLDALEKIGERKGWADLTSDITTIDDAYKLLGNTIDDFLTPVITSITPLIVNMVQGFSGLLNVFTSAPLPIQGVASALLVLGTAFGKMKLEMFKARIFGSEFMARLTGLDDGMYGITRSVGAVNLALKDQMVSFEEGTRCLMDYHYQTIGASMSFREYNEALNENLVAQQAVTAQMVSATGTELEQLSAEQALLVSERERLLTMRETDYAYAQYTLAMKNATITQREQLLNIQRLSGLNKEEMALLMMKTGAIDGETGAIDINTLAKTTNTEAQLANADAGVIERLKARFNAVQASSMAFSKETVAINSSTGAMIGKMDTEIAETTVKELNREETELNTIANEKAVAIAETFIGVNSEKITTEEAEIAVKTALNAITEQSIIVSEEEYAIKQLQAEQLALLTGETSAFSNVKTAEMVITEADGVANEILTASIEKQTIARRMGNTTIGKWVKNLWKSIVATAKEVAQLALLTVEFLLFTPAGWAVDVVLIAITATMYSLIQQQLSLNASLGEYKDLLDNGKQQIEDMDKRLSKLTKGTEEYNAVARRRNQLDAEYKKAQTIKDNSDNAYDSALGKVNAYSQTVIDQINKANKTSFDFSSMSKAQLEITNLSKAQEEFGTVTLARNKALKQSLDNYNQTHKDTKRTTEEQIKFMSDYQQQQVDVVESMEKMKSDSMMERIGGYWDNFWARMAMGWTEAWAGGIENWIQDLPNIIWSKITSIDWGGMATGFLKGATNILDGIVKGLTDLFENSGTSEQAGQGLSQIIMNIGEWIWNNRELIGTLALDIIKLCGLVTQIVVVELPKIISIAIRDMIIDGVNSVDWNGIVENIKSTILYWINPVNWFIEGTTAGTNLFLSILGLDTVSVEETRAVMETSLQTLVDTITYWLNPLNWFTNDNGNGIIQWWNTNIADPLNGVLSVFGIDLHIKSNQAGQNIKKGLNEGSQGVDQVVENNISPVDWVLDKAKGLLGIKSNKVGQNIKSGMKTGSSGTSQPVQSEMDDINTIINNQGGHSWFDSAKDVAKKIIDGIKAGLNRHSPGDGAKTVLAEMEDAGMFIDEQGKVLYDKAKNVGLNIVNGMSNVQDLGQNLNVINDNNQIISSTNQAQKVTTTQYGNMTNTVVDAFGIMSNTANDDMNNVAMNNANYLTKMNKDTQTNMTQIQNTNNTKLKSMQSSTLMVTNNMTKAWGTMKNNIVKSATQIRDTSYAKFSSLHRSISGFYKQIQSASFSGGLPAGNPNLGSGFSSKTTRKRQSLSNTKFAGGVENDYLKLLNKSNRSKKDLEDFYLKYPKALPPSIDAVAGIGETHYKKQYNSAKNWSIKDPTMYGILLRMGYKVSDFNGTAPSIKSVDDFERILTQLFTAHHTQYEYYFNSKKSNQEAWDSGKFNCFDGAELVMEIANDLGFSASMAHGTWNGTPHVSAVVGGKLFDTTQWQNRGIWRGASGVKFGGFAGSPDKGRRVKWSTAGRGRFAGGSTTNNSSKNIVNVTVTGNTFIGEKDYKKQMENIAEDVFYDKMSINPCTGI